MLNGLKNHEVQIIVFAKVNTSTFNHVFNKLNNRVAKFVKDVSEYRRVTITKHPSSLGVVASNGEKMP